MNEQFAKEVGEGLGQRPKSLPSKYFYNDEGSHLFKQIMQLPDYYLTNAELEIMKEKPNELAELLELYKSNTIEIIELGAGDGSKTLHFLKYLQLVGANFVYRPVDISEGAIEYLKANFSKEAPAVKIDAIVSDYAHVHDYLVNHESTRWMFFLGSNLGNMKMEVAKDFLRMITEPLRKGDKLLLGLDKDKSAEKVLSAYNDKSGVTAAFNLNLLKRINKELDANFNLDNFEHAPEYNTELKRAESYIMSTTDQDVYIRSLGRSFSFNKGEKIKTEISQKYDEIVLQEVTIGLGLKMLGRVEDRKRQFMDVVFEIEQG